MKVDESIKTNRAVIGRLRGRNQYTEASGFSSLMEATSGADNVTQGFEPTLVNSTSSMLLVLQSADYAKRENERQAREWGTRMLESLARLQISLLNGGLSVNEIKELQALVKYHKSKDINPELQAILEEIELLAAVELAKLEREGIIT